MAAESPYSYRLPEHDMGVSDEPSPPQVTREDEMWDQWQTSDPNPQDHLISPKSRVGAGAPAHGPVTFGGVERQGRRYETIRVEAGEELPAEEVRVRVVRSQAAPVEPAKIAQDTPQQIGERVVSRRAAQVPAASDKKERISAGDPRGFFGKVNEWQAANTAYTPDEDSRSTYPTRPIHEAVPRPEASRLSAADSEENVLNQTLLGQPQADHTLESRRLARDQEERRKQGAYRIAIVDGKRKVTMGEDDKSEAETEDIWTSYMNTPLPEDEPLLHERLGAWYERARKSLPDKIDNVAQYLKSLGRMEQPRGDDPSQLRQRGRNVLLGCSALLDSLKNFSYATSTAVFNITSAGADKLKELNSKFEPEQRRRAIFGLAVGVVAVGATSYAMRRGFNIADVIGGHEDTVTAKPRQLPHIDGLVDVSPDAPRTGLPLQDAIDQNLADTVTVTPDKTPDTSYTYPWDWAAERFGNDNATPQLHQLAERAAADGHDIVWHNAGTATEWVEVNGSSRTKDILGVLQRYAA